MAKVLLIAVCLMAGVASGIYFKSDSVGQELSRAESSGNDLSNSSMLVSGQQNLKHTLAQEESVKISDAELDTIFRDVESEEMKSALKLSFSHPLTDGTNAGNGFEASIQKLNQDPQASLNEISKLLIKLESKNDGLRTHLLNLAMQTNADPVDKGELIKDYLTKANFNTDISGLSDDSYSAVVAIDYLAQNFRNESEVQLLVGEILSIDDEKLKNEMKTRLAVHYPGII